MRPTPPPKPYPDFPLFAHASGQWRKDVRVNGGKPIPFYFGTWADDPEGERALRNWIERKDAIRAGLDKANVRTVAAGLTLAEVIPMFLEAKQDALLAGKLADETFNDYRYELQLFADFMGATAQVNAIGPDHFAKYARHLAAPDGRALGPHRRATAIRYVRAFFNHAGAQGWIRDQGGHPRPPQFGAGFTPPSTDPDALAAEKIHKGEDADAEPMFEAAQVAWLLERATPAFRAMILLSLNCGIGPSDLARLRWKHVDMATGRLSLRRGKNGIRREAYLWRRTRKALERVRSLKHCSAAIKRDGEEALVFLTRRNQPFVRRERVIIGDRVKKTKVANAISITFGRWVQEAKEAGVIPAGHKLTYYNLRHTYYTHAENHPDLNAVHRTMGHALAGMGRRYKRKPLPLSRLKPVALLVKRALFPKPAPAATKSETSSTPPMQLARDADAAAA